MKRRLFFWFFAALPATLAGHSVAYWFAGRQQGDAHHWYFAPAVQWSAVVLGAYCAYVLAQALWGRGNWLAKPGNSITRNWFTLALMQVALFALLERVEGYTPGAAGFLAQILVALVAAFVVASFAGVVRRCDRAGVRASRYVHRMVRASQTFLASFAPVTPAYALSARAGRALFSRPPPIA